MDIELHNSPPISSRSSSSSASESSSSASSRGSSSTSSIAALLHPDNISPTTSLSALPHVPLHTETSHDDNARRSVDNLQNGINDDEVISIDPPSTSPQPPTTTTTTSASTSTKPTSKAPRSKAQNDPNAPASSKHHKHRTPSPSPPPVLPPPPLQTIRLSIKLGGPDNYSVDVRNMARDSGQRPATPEVAVLPTVVSDSESEPEKAAPDAKDGKKKKKRKDRTERYYDTSDPFIDDSELALDERTFFAQTKQQGFYVSSGEVALMKDPNATPRKPKSRKEKEKEKEKEKVEGKNYLGGLGLSVSKGMGISVKKGGAKTPAVTKKDGAGKEKDAETLITRVETSISAPPGMGTSYSNGDGGRVGSGPPEVQAIKSEPMGVDQEHTEGHENGVSISAANGVSNGSTYEDAKTGEKRKRYTTYVEGGKKKKMVELSSFSTRLQEEVEKMKAAIAAESWEQKGKFPPSLKPQLASLALLAIQLDEYDDHFFNLMPQLFPYNKFTMSKLIKRTIFAEHTALLHQRQEALLQELKKQADEGFATAEEEWKRSVVAWDKRQKKLQDETANGGGSAAGDDDSGAPTRHPTEEMDVDHPALSAGGGETPGAGKDKGTEPPGKKYRLTESMKGIIWQLVLLSNECCRLENEKNQLEGSLTVISEQGSRKNLYQKMIACFPDGWLSSGQISRDVSAMKKKFEKEAMENEV